MGTAGALTLQQGAAHLAGIVGQDHIGLRGGTIIASPGDIGQVAEILRFAYDNRLTLMPSGGETKLDWGNPVAPHIQLSMRRMSRLREHPWQDMTCTVDAGCTWEAMQVELARHGQFVALDPLWPDQATVGGIVACNDSGVLRLKYGGLRDLIIGMTVVLADGTIARSGGKVVKNVAGYDIHKLMTGSFGTLGVIAEVTFRLHPLEEHSRSWTAVAPDTRDDASSFAEALRALMDSQITPSSVQLRASRQECALDIRVAAVPECLDEIGARIHSSLRKLQVVPSEADVWGARQQAFASKEALVLKVSVVPGEICPVSSELQQWARSGDTKIAIIAQATGLMTVSIDSAGDSARMLLERLRAHVNSSGGSVITLQVPEELRGAVDVWGPETGTMPLMREIKRCFDPGPILNPGRFVGNI
jgi:glycolate oxidase FAD binding subunit